MILCICVCSIEHIIIWGIAKSTVFGTLLPNMARFDVLTSSPRVSSCNVVFKGQLKYLHFTPSSITPSFLNAAYVYIYIHIPDWQS